MKKMSLMIILTLLSNTAHSMDSDTKYREKLQNLHIYAGSFFFIATCLGGYFSYYQIKSIKKIDTFDQEALDKINEIIDTTNTVQVDLRRRFQESINKPKEYPIFLGIATFISAVGLCQIAKSIWDTETQS